MCVNKRTRDGLVGICLGVVIAVIGFALSASSVLAVQEIGVLLRAFGILAALFGLVRVAMGLLSQKTSTP